MGIVLSDKNPAEQECCSNWQNQLKIVSLGADNGKLYEISIFSTD